MTATVISLFAERAVASMPLSAEDKARVIRLAEQGHEAVFVGGVDPELPEDVSRALRQLSLRLGPYIVADAVLATGAWSVTDFIQQAYRYKDTPWDEAVDAWLFAAKCCKPANGDYELYCWLKGQAHAARRQGATSLEDFTWRIWKVLGDFLGDAYPKATPEQVAAWKRSQR